MKTTDARTSSVTTGTPDPTTNTADLSVENIVTTPALIGPNSPDSIGTYGESNEQFLIGTARTPGPSVPNRSSITVEAMESLYSPEEPGEYVNWGDYWVNGERFPATAEETLLYTLPRPLETDKIAINWSGGHQTLDEDVVDRLTRPPAELEVTKFSTPDSVTSGEKVTLTLEVENVGSTSGIFVGALNRVGPQVAYTPVTGVTFELEGGESTTWTHSYTPFTDASSEERRMSFNMHWRGGHLSSETAVKPN
ncbi:hypothetical protein ACFQE1_01580 [Halobium palmae]|uniref:CARDB domain-containing protein n=1 Tax=Halobium palmae TaxID=1776492 RepID=A0ABD5RVC5_9EURY